MFLYIYLFHIAAYIRVAAVKGPCSRLGCRERPRRPRIGAGRGPWRQVTRSCLGAVLFHLYAFRADLPLCAYDLCGCIAHLVSVSSGCRACDSQLPRCQLSVFGCCCQSTGFTPLPCSLPRLNQAWSGPLQSCRLLEADACAPSPRRKATQKPTLDLGAFTTRVLQNHNIYDLVSVYNHGFLATSVH